MVTNELVSSKDSPNQEAHKLQEILKSKDVPQSVGNGKVHKIPRAIRLGPTYVVTIKKLSIAGMLHVSPDSDELGGMWNDRTRTIYICKDQSLDEQWYYYRHELVHALNDAIHALLPDEASTALQHLEGTLSTAPPQTSVPVPCADLRTAPAE